jgi:hypothetical protein
MGFFVDKKYTKRSKKLKPNVSKKVLSEILLKVALSTINQIKSTNLPSTGGFREED